MRSNWSISFFLAHLNPADLRLRIGQGEGMTKAKAKAKASTKSKAKTAPKPRAKPNASKPDKAPGKSKAASGKRPAGSNGTGLQSKQGQVTLNYFLSWFSDSSIDSIHQVDFFGN